MVLLKIGGSLLTKKELYCQLDFEYVCRLAESIVTLRSKLPARFVIVAGGGSFGSGIMLKLGLNGKADELDRCDYSTMTRVMFKYISEICEIFSDFGVASFPVQLAPFLCSARGFKNFSRPIDAILDAKIIPLISSDFFRLGCNEWEVMPSDRLLVELTGSLEVDRVVALTDKRGVIDFSLGKTVGLVTEANLADVLKFTGGSDSPDATGGMKAKLLELVKISRIGIEAAILDGRDPLRGLEDCFSDWRFRSPQGTVIQVRDRV